MFLTRLGFGSKIVITGDVDHIDLPDGKPSGLKEAIRRGAAARGGHRDLPKPQQRGRGAPCHGAADRGGVRTL